MNKEELYGELVELQRNIFNPGEQDPTGEARAMAKTALHDFLEKNPDATEFRGEALREALRGRND